MRLSLSFISRHTNRIFSSHYPLRAYILSGRRMSQSTSTSTVLQPSQTPSTFQYIDIGANMLDSMFQGIYNNKTYHKPDLDAVFQRAKQSGVQSIIITASDLYESIQAIRLCRKYNRLNNTNNVNTSSSNGDSLYSRLYCTVGVHPTNTTQLEGSPRTRPDHESVSVNLSPSSSSSSTIANTTVVNSNNYNDDDPLEPYLHRTYTDSLSYITALREIIQNGVQDRTVVAIGECGLDYDRLYFSPKDIQLKHFSFHFDLAKEFGLPLFLHNRNTEGDFERIMKDNIASLPHGGVVHSFTGTLDEMRSLLQLGLFIGINGCSLKTEENCQVVKEIPIQSLLLETDAPWCNIKNTHSSSSFVRTRWPIVKREKYVDGQTVKDRCEPCHIVQVAEVVSNLQNTDLSILVEQVYQNTQKLFRLGGTKIEV